MLNNKILILSFLTVFLLYNLPSSAQSISAQKKVALVSFSVNKDIDCSEVKGIFGILTDIKKLRQDSSFNLQPTLDKFHKTFCSSYMSKFPFELLPEESVLQNPEYISFESPNRENKHISENKFWWTFLTPPGYNRIYEGGAFKKKNRNEMKLLRIFDEADGIMFVDMAYSFINDSGINLVKFYRVKATVNIVLLNKEGKKVLRITEHGMSSQKISFYSGIALQPLQLLPLCKSSSDKIMKDLDRKLPRLVKKVNKKL